MRDAWAAPCQPAENLARQNSLYYLALVSVFSYVVFLDVPSPVGVTAKFQTLPLMTRKDVKDDDRSGSNP